MGNAVPGEDKYASAVSGRRVTASEAMASIARDARTCASPSRYAYEPITSRFPGASDATHVRISGVCVMRFAPARDAAASERVEPTGGEASSSSSFSFPSFAGASAKVEGASRGRRRVLGEGAESSGSPGDDGDGRTAREEGFGGTQLARAAEEDEDDIFEVRGGPSRGVGVDRVEGEGHVGFHRAVVGPTTRERHRVGAFEDVSRRGRVRGVRVAEGNGNEGWFGFRSGAAHDGGGEGRAVVRAGQSLA